ncbi:hypothetical protein pv_33 [Pithovirus sibericum]|uniref:Uncharacterized protein n=1 Tax=Pithovirus sibericum TaxID=1450746 RepID=W5SA11_9VIRU|nr:hypothetical protein pv_33 [Pithovirus sibericum]AHH01600.1 hypothetical protein pv_33 [Pithovirus sibericum]
MSIVPPPSTYDKLFETSDLSLSGFHFDKASSWLKALEEDTIHRTEEGLSTQKSAVYVSMLRIQSAAIFPKDFFDHEKVDQFLALSRQHNVLEKQGEHTAPGQIILTYIKSKNQFKVRFQNYNVGYTHDEYIVYLNKEQVRHLLFLYSYFDLHPYNAFCRPLEEDKEEVSKKI